jgi:hypothetical protein
VNVKNRMIFIDISKLQEIYQEEIS